MKERQRAAGAAYAAGLEARDAARAALLRAEHGAAGAEAEGLHFRAELESSQVGVSLGGAAGY